MKPHSAILLSKKQNMYVLGIESTCDETACSIVQNGRKIFSNVIYSQQEIHKRYGGVYPEVACREHIEAIIPAIELALREASIKSCDIDLIAVSKGPGLMGALLIGLNVAKALSFAWDIPFVGVNHVEAHLYAAMMPLDTIPLPALGIVISGGHTFMLKIDALGSYQMLGRTLDDAIGEAFDKVAVLLGLPYPGGPHIEKAAKLGNPKAYPFKPAKMQDRPYDFSFSGLKTAVLYATKGKESLSETDVADIAASFQRAAIDSIVDKGILLAKNINAKAIFLGGGVSCNLALRAAFEKKAGNMPLYFPELPLCVDNAAMVAGLGYHKFLAQGGDSLELEPKTRIPNF